MSQTPDPDERFSLYPLEADEVFKRLFEGAGTESEDLVTDEPEDAEEI